MFPYAGSMPIVGGRRPRHPNMTTLPNAEGHGICRHESRAIKTKRKTSTRSLPMVKSTNTSKPSRQPVRLASAAGTYLDDIDDVWMPQSRPCDNYRHRSCRMSPGPSPSRPRIANPLPTNDPQRRVKRTKTQPRTTDKVIAMLRSRKDPCATS